MFYHRKHTTNFATQGGGVAFSPLSLPGLLAWYKGDAGISNAGTGTMTWADQSGNGNTLVIEGTGTSPINTNTQNSLKVVTFAGAECLSMNANTLAVGNTTLSCFCVASPGGGGRVASFASTSAGGDYANVLWAQLINLNSSGFGFLTERNFNTYSSTPTLTNGTWYELGIIYDGTNAKQYVNNGAPDINPSTGTFGTGSFTVGDDSGAYGSAKLTGSVGEIFIGNADWTSYTSQIHTYFNGRWNV